jgi:hypothetical protein
MKPDEKPGSGQSAPIVSKPEWDAHLARVVKEMQEYTRKFVTPISRALDHDYGEHLATGNYVEIFGQKYLLTNAHVAEALRQHSLGHQFLDHECVFRATNPFFTFSLPFDVAFSAIDPKVWDDAQHSSLPIPESKLSMAHAPVDREVFFIKGFGGEGSDFHFGYLVTHATSYCCQEVPVPSEEPFNAQFHFALDYRPDLATTVEVNSRGLPIPKGLSGSVVWNTRFVELWGNGSDWNPDCAEVTGLLWGWPSSAACVVATRIEYVRSFLLRAITSMKSNNH